MIDIKDLANAAHMLNTELALNRREGINDDNALDVQVLSFAEEAGELVGAYRKWAGKARRVVPLSEVEGEVADVLITCAGLADMLGIDISQAVNAKLAVIYSRGWKTDE